MGKTFISLAVALALSCFSRAQVLTSGGRLKPEQAIMDIRHYTIALKVDIPDSSIDGYAVVDFVLSQASPVLLFDLLDSFHIHGVSVDGSPAVFSYKNNLISITGSFAQGRHSVRVDYGGKPHIAIHPPWDDGFIWTRDSTGNPWVAITAEGTGGKLYFPCKDHPSDEPNEGVDMLITVPSGLVVAGPGLLQEVTPSGASVTYHWKTRYTINNYSIIFNVGKYKVVSRDYTTIDGHTVPMQFYVLEEHASKAPHHLEILEKTVHEQEKYFGEYPWAREKIGIVETPHLGMEHQTMNAYGNKFRYTQVGGSDYDGLMHHEFGHEWWGNKITAKDWADYWIHEGICTFGDALYIREFEGEEAYDRYFARASHGFRNQQPIVLGHDIDEEAAYQPDIYGKGAFFMHTLRFVIGDSLFFPLLKGFATDPRYTYDNLVGTDDVEQYFSRGSGMQLKPLFDLYIRSVGLLQVSVRQVDAGHYAISTVGMPLTLPLEVGTDSGVQRIMVGSAEQIVASSSKPVIDPRVFYLTKVINAAPAAGG
jgi:aminopeptidase N